jgi:5S rRNA maturation endonuclease (ribonuclease M5)
MDELFEEIKECISRCRSKPAIVEGKKDKEALEELGFMDIIEIDGPLFKVVEYIEGRRIKNIMILTDLDPEGKRLYSKLKGPLQDRGIKIDDALRNLLWKSQVRQIEGLATHLKNIS